MSIKFNQISSFIGWKVNFIRTIEAADFEDQNTGFNIGINGSPGVPLKSLKSFLKKSMT